MLRLSTLICLFLLLLVSCQNGNRALFLRMDSMVHNGNFIPSYQVPEEPGGFCRYDGSRAQWHSLRPYTFSRCGN